LGKAAGDDVIASVDPPGTIQMPFQRSCRSTIRWMVWVVRFRWDPRRWSLWNRGRTRWSKLGTSQDLQRWSSQDLQCSEPAERSQWRRSNEIQTLPSGSQPTGFDLQTDNLITCKRSRRLQPQCIDGKRSNQSARCSVWQPM